MGTVARDVALAAFSKPIVCILYPSRTLPNALSHPFPPPLKWQSENAPMTANRNMSLSSEKPIQDLKLVLKHYVRTEGDYSVAFT